MDTRVYNRSEALLLLRNFLSVIPNLQNLRNAHLNQERKSRLSEFRNFSVRLIPLYEDNLNKARERLINCCAQNKRLLSLTTFEVMKKQALEETHSNVLAYLLNQKQGSQLLSKMLEYLYPDGVDMLQQLNCKGYKVYREKEICKKRIDILIEANKFLIAIENKFNAKIHQIDEYYNQTDFYFSEISKTYKQEYKKFILLDYKGTETCSNYTSMDYNDLLKVLESVEENYRGDVVYEEYLILLKRLLYNLDKIPTGELEEIYSLSAIYNLTEELFNGTKKGISTI